MLDMNGKTMLARVIDRVALAKLPVYVVTSSSKEDDLIEYEARKSGVNDVYRGDLFDVRGRLFLAAKKFNLQYIARVTADNPFSDPRFILKGFSYLKNGASYARAKASSCPDGTNVEVFKLNELTTSIEKDSRLQDLYDMEHVTYQMINRLKLTHQFVEFDPEIENLKGSEVYHLGVDYLEDYIKLNKIYQLIDENILSRMDLLDFVLGLIAKQYNDYPKGRRYEL
jgi:spore coat polysaccharide biosynthesis protein SpsF